MDDVHLTGEVFEDIGIKPTWVLAMVILVIVGVGAQLVIMPHVDTEATIRASFEERGTDLSEAQIENAVEQTEKFAKFAPIIGLVIAPIMWAIMAAVFFLMLKIVGSDADYSRSLSTTLYGYWPPTLVALVLTSVLVQRLGKVPQEELANVVKANLGAFMSPDAPAWLLAVGKHHQHLQYLGGRPADHRLFHGRQDLQGQGRRRDAGSLGRVDRGPEGRHRGREGVTSAFRKHQYQRREPVDSIRGSVAGPPGWKVKMKKALIVTGVLVVLALVVWASLRDSGPRGAEVEVQAAEVRTVSSRVKATGEITPEKRVAISAKVVGEIINLPVVEGQEVRTGQLLLEIERDLYEAARNQARAALRQAEVSVKRQEVQLADAERNMRRTKELIADGLVSQEALDAAQLQLDTAAVEIEAQQHSVEQYRSALQRTEDDLARTTIRSPMDGVIIQLNAEQGETVVPGSTNLPGSVIMTVADMSVLLAEVEVSEVDVVDVELGQEAEVKVDALGTDPQKGHVVEIATSGPQGPGPGHHPLCGQGRDRRPRPRPATGHDRQGRYPHGHQRGRRHRTRAGGGQAPAQRGR